MIHTFHCPNCHASLDHDTSETTVRCPYCNTTVIVPEALRQRSAANTTFTDSGMSALLSVTQLARHNQLAEAAEIYRYAFKVSQTEAEQVVRQIASGTMGASSTTTIVLGEDGRQVVRRAGWAGCGVVLFITLLTFGLAGGIWIAMAGSMAAVISTIEEAIGATSPTTANEPPSQQEPATSLIRGTAVPDTPTPAPTATPAFAPLALQFGGEGTGPGKFDDTRAIGVDGAGQIYTADYSDGRVQLFDPAGQFITTYSLGEDIYLPTLFVSRDGVNLFVLHSGRVWQYDAQTGAQIAPLTSNNQLVQDLAPTIDGGWVTLQLDGQSDVITRYNAQGEVVATFRDLGRNYDNDLRPQRVIMGNQFDIYLLTGGAILHFNPEGNLIDKVSSEGRDEESQYASPQALAVDTTGRLYVAGSQNVKVYGEDGRYLATIPYPAPSSVAFNITITLADELFVMDRNGNQVLKYDLP